MMISLRRVAPLLLAAACHRAPTTAPVPVRPALPAIAVIPQPMEMSVRPGEFFTITAATSIVADTTREDMRRAIAALTAFVRPSTGFQLPVVAQNNPVPVTLPPNLDTLRRTAIVLRLLTFIAPDPLGGEGYSMEVTRDTVLVTASSGAGLFHGVQTLRQLLPWAIETHEGVTQKGPWRIPAMSLRDMPVYRWRGAMLDVARHFFTVDEVKQVIDILALYKLNSLHLHLADDQGWRIEIKSHPELAAMGSPSEVGGGPGGYFTQDDYKSIVKYADDRYVTIVPEIDMPAHINAALISHPELSCGRRPPMTYTGIDVGFSAICPDSEASYALIDDVVREVTGMSPGGYFHIGGDEVQAITAAQYARFVERVNGIVRKYNARAVGWEDIGKAAIDSTTILQMWQGDSLHTGGALPNDVLVSAASRLYLDMRYAVDRTELGLRWAGYIDVQKAYDWDPRTDLKGFATSRIIGLEAPLWSETPRNITAAEYLLMPRLPAVAELAWTPRAGRRWDDFRLRLAAQAPRWIVLGINFYRSPQIPW
jgi:hexosaminidase